MKRILLALGLLLGLSASATAQCVNVGGVNTVPQPGIVCMNDPIVPTYIATGYGIVPGATPTDIACLSGSATRTIRVKQVRVSGTAGTAINIIVLLLKRASANTGGTAALTTALPVPYPLDSTFAAATATGLSWTANPTIVDTTPGVISAQTMFLPVTSTATAGLPAVFNWDNGGPSVSPPVLRGVAQGLCVNLNGVTTPSSGVMSVSFMWNEQTQ